MILCIHVNFKIICIFHAQPTFHFQKHPTYVWYGTLEAGGGDGRPQVVLSQATAHHATLPLRNKHRWEQNKLWMGPLVVGRLSGRAQHPLHSADCREPLSRQLPTSSGSAAGWLPSTFIVCDASEKVHPGKCELCVLMAKNGKWYAYFTVRAKYPYLKVFTRNHFFFEFCPTYM